ncbi:hypothetical protein BDZ91DRAFT_712065 [Kalaharituber pfeilii]|nr:hypothetical protein BDZ91DRAFT_712065 [Kalaharituber pfeilii]
MNDLFLRFCVDTIYTSSLDSHVRVYRDGKCKAYVEEGGRGIVLPYNDTNKCKK